MTGGVRCLGEDVLKHARNSMSSLFLVTVYTLYSITALVIAICSIKLINKFSQWARSNCPNMSKLTGTSSLLLVKVLTLKPDNK